jgi:spore maturation protein CgeB
MHVASDFTRQELDVRARGTEQILKEVRTAHQHTPIDLFLSYFYNSHFDPAGFQELGKLGIPSANFFCNSIYQFELTRAIAATVDFAWHPERDARHSYLSVGASPVWVQMGADPNVYHPVEGLTRKPAACFIGQRYADRDRLLSRLVEARIPVDIYGAGWIQLPVEPSRSLGSRDRFYLGRKQLCPGSGSSYARVFRKNIEKEGVVGGFRRTVRQWQYRRQTRSSLTRLHAQAKGRAEDVAATLAEYEVCLNFSNVWADGRPGSKLISHVRLRDFEAPMCGTCYLTGHTNEIEEFYEIGKEIDTYSSAAELIDKTRFYLSNRDAAERIRSAGYARARRDHTWVRRFEELFGKIGLRARVSQTKR